MEPKIESIFMSQKCPENFFFERIKRNEKIKRTSKSIVFGSSVSFFKRGEGIKKRVQLSYIVASTELFGSKLVLNKVHSRK